MEWNIPTSDESVEHNYNGNVQTCRSGLHITADPSAVKAAADAGVCIPGAIVVNDVPMHPVLVDGVWTMAEEGDTISRGACIVIKASTILTAEDYEGEYTNCFEGPAGILQLVEVDGVATLDNP
jgi:hypothetical protein